MPGLDQVLKLCDTVRLSLGIGCMVRSQLQLFDNTCVLYT